MIASGPHGTDQITDIRTDGGTQPREKIDPDVVNDYAESAKAGAKFPAVVVFYDGEFYWLADGFHRVMGFTQAGMKEIEADVRQGRVEDAQWHSYSANQKHGLRRTNADKERAVRAALGHPKAGTMSDRLIAEHIGVDHKTVARHRTTGEFPQSAARTGRDGRTINTSNIGRKGVPVSQQDLAAMAENLDQRGWDNPKPGDACVREEPQTASRRKPHRCDDCGKGIDEPGLCVGCRYASAAIVKMKERARGEQEKQEPPVDPGGADEKACDDLLGLAKQAERAMGRLGSMVSMNSFSVVQCRERFKEADAAVARLAQVIRQGES